MIYDAQVTLKDRQQPVTAEALRHEAFGIRHINKGLMEYYHHYNDEEKVLNCFEKSVPLIGG